MKFYIKNKFVFSKDTKIIHLPANLEEFSIPTTSKNLLINNKILITDIEKLCNLKGKEFTISRPIKDFNSLKNKINKLNDKYFIKPKDDDYDFIEKTSAIDIINNLISSIDNSQFNNIKTKIDTYIEQNTPEQKEKLTQISQQIEEENELIKKYESEKNNIPISNEQKKIDDKITKLNNEITRLDNFELKPHKSKNDTISIQNKIIEIEQEIKNIEFETKINKTKIKEFKIEYKSGKRKHFTKWTILLMFLTLGLIYWTRFVTIKYFIKRYETKDNKLDRKKLELEKEKFNLIEEQKKAMNKKNESETKIIEESNKNKEKIKDLKDELKKLEKEKLEIEKNTEKQQKYNSKIEQKQSKHKDKIKELETTKSEFERYSLEKISKQIEILEKKRNDEINLIEDIKNQILKQNIEKSGEFIVEIE